MNDDFTALRTTMSLLAEHGGDADLHDRMLRTSQRITRRNRIAGTVAAAVAIVAIGTPFALAGTGQGTSPEPAVVATQPSVAVTTSPPVTPSYTPSSATPHHSSSSATPAGGCPVSSPELFDAVEAEQGAGVVKSGDKWRNLECHDGWAVAWYVQKVPVSDPGAYVFKYSARTGGWTVAGEGSGGYCEAYLPKHLLSKFTKVCG